MRAAPVLFAARMIRHVAGTAIITYRHPTHAPARISEILAPDFPPARYAIHPRDRAVMNAAVLKSRRKKSANEYSRETAWNHLTLPALFSIIAQNARNQDIF
jgi:hypothetical protein